MRGRDIRPFAGDGMLSWNIRVPTNAKDRTNQKCPRRSEYLDDDCRVLELGMNGGVQ